LKEENMDLQALLDHTALLYGRRNRIYLPSLRDLIDYLNLSIGDLQDAVRKDVGREAIGVALARVTCRVFEVADHFKDLPLVAMMVAKFPAGHCSYCHHFPCDCPPEHRLNAILETNHDPAQLQWSLSDWCNHFAGLYGTKNKERGIGDILNRLFREASEFLSLCMHAQGATVEEAEREFALELADTLSWTIAVANFFEVDLEEAYLRRYGNGCVNCKRSSCNCTARTLTPKRWHKRKR
jgi:NTP pyrophosphatase (non-canonical NTP hydrolase)